MPQIVGRASMFMNGKFVGSVDQVCVVDGVTHLIELKTEKLRQMGMAFSHAAFIRNFGKFYSNQATRYHKRLLKQWRNRHESRR